MMERYGYAIFCDDIRNEPGGKLTFVGCYNAVMFTEREYPIVLPKFCIHFHIFSPATQPYRSVFARCYTPGEKDPIAKSLSKSRASRTRRTCSTACQRTAAPRLSSWLLQAWCLHRLSCQSQG